MNLALLQTSFEIFNFSIFDLQSYNAYCYLWNLSVSGREAYEVLSCIFEFLVAKSRWKEKSCTSFRHLCVFVHLC